MNATVEYLQEALMVVIDKLHHRDSTITDLSEQVELLTKELKDSESDNASLHRQLDHWQEISVHWKNARDVLVDERDELTLIVERVTADMRALAAERDFFATKGR